MSSHETTDNLHEFDAHVFSDYTVQVDMDRKFVEVSDAFCNVLGYSRKELIGRRLDEVTAPRTNDVPVVFELFVRNRYMHGIWILLNRSKTTRIIVRYEGWLRPNSRIDCNMELLGAGG